MANKKKNSDKAIYRLYMDFRGGEITGMFLADKKYIEYMIEHEVSVHFGEVLGKHSDVRTTICDSDIEMVSDEENVIDFFKKYKFENGKIKAIISNNRFCVTRILQVGLCKLCNSEKNSYTVIISFSFSSSNSSTFRMYLS